MRRNEVFLELVLILVFAFLAWVVMGTPVLAIDVQIERAVQSVGSSGVDSFTAAISWIGFPPQSTLIDAVIVLIIFLTGRRWDAVCAIVAAGGSAGIWFLVAPLVHRPRPTADLVRVVADIPFGSFPSGHVLNITAFFGFLIVVCSHRLAPGIVRSLCIAACGLLIASIGIARIYSGEHWPSDVLAGYVLGAAWLLLTWWVYRWRADR